MELLAFASFAGTATNAGAVARANALVIASAISFFMRVSSLAYVGLASRPSGRPTRVRTGRAAGSRRVYGILNAPGNDFGYSRKGDVAFLARCNATTGVAQWRLTQPKSDKTLFLLRKL